MWHLKFSMFMPCSLPSNRWQDANPTLPLFMIAVRRQDRRGQGPLQGVLWLSLRNVVLSSAVSREGFLNYSSAVASLPMPPATRRISPSCRQCCRERRRRREMRTPCKMGLSWGPSSFPPQDNSGAAERPLERLRLRGVRSAYLQGDGGLGMAPRVRRVGARSAACRGLPRRATVERRVVVRAGRI